MHLSSTGTEAPVLGTLLGSHVSLHLAVHLYSLSHPLLHDKLANVSKCVPEFCELF